MFASDPANQPAGPLTGTHVADRYDDMDRLVSGDLDDDHRQSLLAWMEADPRRWRRCGLAFVEAQTLRESFAPLAEQPADTRPNRAAGVTGAPKRHALATVAAAVLISFAFGGAFGYGVRAPQIMHSQIDALPHHDDARMVDSTNDAAPQPVARDADAGHLETPTGLAMLRLRTGTGEHVRQFDVPVRDARSAAGQPLRHPELPQYVRSQWERKGYRVTEQRRLMPLRLEDGRQVVIPLAEVKLTYVGRQSL